MKKQLSCCLTWLPSAVNVRVAYCLNSLEIASDSMPTGKTTKSIKFGLTAAINHIAQSKHDNAPKMLLYQNSIYHSND